LITLVVLTTNQTLEQVGVHVRAALNIGVSPVGIKEAIYQCAPYIGFPKTLNAMYQANEVFKEKNISLPVESQKQVTEETRFDEGLKVQKSIFGDIIDQMHKNAPENQKHIQNYLSAFCFGDIYTRSGLDLQTRELLTLCILITLGGCEGQVKAHINGNSSVGNSKETLISAITQCLPYIGFPKTLNAISCLNKVIPEKN
jgi:4-carboxymuconolactone decarboxylase